MQSMQDYKKEAILEQKQQRAEKAINDLMSSFDEKLIKEFKEQIKNKTTNGTSIKESVIDLTTTSSETTYTDKAKLLLALQEYAKTIK